MSKVRAFAQEIGTSDRVACVGGRTQWNLGGRAEPGVREVCAPRGIVEIVPEEMIVRAGAGTPLWELHQALAEVGQRVAMPDAGGWGGRASEDEGSKATVGGALAVGFGGLGQIRLGPPRDSVLEVSYVTAQGELSKSGGSVVKNVSGFDLCRLLVGSLGTLGFVAEVVLRATPKPSHSQWFRGPVPGSRAAGKPCLQDLIHAPGSLLVTNRYQYVLLEGHQQDVIADEALLTQRDFEPVEAPPALLDKRCSVKRGTEYAEGLASGAEFVGLMGTGIITGNRPVGARWINPAAASINRALKEAFDPTGRLNPGRDVLFGTTEAEGGESR